MGSEKYPDENAFDSFIKKHGGNDNAFTDCERVSDHEATLLMVYIFSLSNAMYLITLPLFEGQFSIHIECFQLTT